MTHCENRGQFSKTILPVRHRLLGDGLGFHAERSGGYVTGGGGKRTGQAATDASAIATYSLPLKMFRTKNLWRIELFPMNSIGSLVVDVWEFPNGVPRKGNNWSGRYESALLKKINSSASQAHRQRPLFVLAESFHPVVMSLQPRVFRCQFVQFVRGKSLVPGMVS